MDIRTKIKETGLKATPQRRLIYEIINELCHASIDDIIARVHERSPDITVSTVYRILESFCNTGLLAKITHPTGKTYFDINPTEHHHIFGVDNRIIDFEDEHLTELIKEKVKEKITNGEEIQRISIQITTQKSK